MNQQTLDNPIEGCNVGRKLLELPRERARLRQGRMSKPIRGRLHGGRSIHCSPSLSNGEVIVSRESAIKNFIGPERAPKHALEFSSVSRYKSGGSCPRMQWLRLISS